MTRLILAAVVGGCVLSYFGFNHWRLAQKCEPTPSEITIATLFEEGPDGIENAHVTLSEFMPSDGFVYQTEDDKPSVWTHVYVPVTEFDSDYGRELILKSIGAELAGQDTIADDQLPTMRPDEVRAILKLTGSDCRNLRLQTALAREKMTGVVINQIDLLNSDTKRLLKELVPGFDSSDMAVIEIGRDVPSSGNGMAMLGGGGLLALLGVGGGIRKFGGGAA